MTDEHDLRPDDEMDSRVNTWLTDTDLSPDEANAGLERLLEEFPTTPQARRRFLGRWLHRHEGAGRRTTEHDYAANTNRRNRLMLSATGITAALAILALTISFVGTDPTPPDAVGATLVVAADGEYTTIQSAVDAAEDGDTVLVTPGTYIEAIIIDKDITLTGDGPREDIVLIAPADGPTVPVEADAFAEEPYAVLLRDTKSTLSGLTFRGGPSGVIANGGAPIIEKLHFDTTGRVYDGSFAVSSILVNAGSSPVIRDNTLTSGGPIRVFEQSAPQIEDNLLTGGPIISGLSFGDGTVIRGNTIEDPLDRAIGMFNDSGVVLIEGNVISNPGAVGIDIWAGEATIIGNTVEAPGTDGIKVIQSGNAVLIEGNDISVAGLVAIRIEAGEPVIRGNTIRDAALAVQWAVGEGAIEGNTIHGGRHGISVASGAPAVADNVIEGAESQGISIAAGATPILTGNGSCDNGQNLVVEDGSEAGIHDTNEICEDTPSE